MFHRTATEELIQQVLGADYVALKATGYHLMENLGDGQCSVEVKLVRTAALETIDEITGVGVGFIDALYHGLLNHYAREFPSLNTIVFTAFDVTGDMATSHKQGADATCVVTLSVQNTDGRIFRFEESGRSLVAASLQVVVEAAEYFINSEKAYVTVYKAMADAKERNRPDLIETYTAHLAQLVKTTSYSEVIEKIHTQL
ncbi:MAG: hypothetical protein VYA30_07520 [Myxococcota bacterium]|nr:hypothetical protein [Myxococcota bacterium]